MDKYSRIEQDKGRYHATDRTRNTLVRSIKLEGLSTTLEGLTLGSSVVGVLLAALVIVLLTYVKERGQSLTGCEPKKGPDTSKQAEATTADRLSTITLDIEGSDHIVATVSSDECLEKQRKVPTSR